MAAPVFILPSNPVQTPEIGAFSSIQLEIMGNHASGRRRPKQPTFEDLERRDARDFGTRREAMPDGTGTREMGLCPQCDQGAREVFKWPDAQRETQGEAPEVWACRRCLMAQGVRHRSENERGTIAEKLKHSPELLAEAIESAATFARTVESGAPTDEKGFRFAMGIFNAAAQQEAEAPEEIELAQVQAQIVADDLTRTTRLAEHLEKMIFAGVENHTDRKGDSSVIPMRPDSLAKLGNLYLGALNVRANRAGIATSISERRNAGEGVESIREEIGQRLKERGHRATGAISLEQLESSEPLYLPEPAPEVVEGEIYYDRSNGEEHAGRK